MSETDYRIELDLYNGPMDLLLYLVRRNEVDPVALPIAKITAQFVEYLAVLQFLDLDLVGEFVVTASTLVELKSRLVLPQPEDETEQALEEQADEPHSELIAQLLEYKKYKDAARALEERAAQWQERYPRLSEDRPVVGKDPAADRIKEVELWDLVSALGRILQHKVVEEETSVRRDDTPLSVYIERVGARVRKEGRITFSSFFEQTHFRPRIVGVFLAILELLRHHQFRADQPQAHGEIWILPPADEAAETEDAAEAENVAEEATGPKAEPPRESSVED